MYQYLVIGRDKSYFVKSHPKSSNKYKQDEIIQMLDFLIDNIYCSVWGTGVSTNDWYSSGSELFSPLLAHLDRCDVDNHRKENGSVTEHHLYSGSWN
jgi:hypothetical protein